MKNLEVTSADPTTLERFADLWKAAGCESDARELYDRLRIAWSEPARFYHTWRHLTDCLRELQAARPFSSACHHVEIEIAIWFHDAVYDPQASDNEERSAEMARRALTDGGAAQDFVDRVVALIMATKTHVASQDSDAELLLDIDLSILGQSPERYQEYENAIRAEYSWVRLNVFASKRAAILQSFLRRERLYLTPHFHDRYEVQARANLRAAIVALNLPPH